MTLILLHSAGASSQIWDRVRAHLVGLPVLAPPLPGREDAGPPAEDVATHAAALLDVMDDAGIERAAIAGHSLGGAVALWLALEHRDRVAAIGLINCGARMRVARQMFEALPDGLAPILDLVVASNFPAGSPAEWLAERRDAYELTGGATLLADLTACNRFDVLDRLWEIRCRTQILAGSEDTLTPARYARQMAERISAARYTEYPGAGHMLPIELPGPVAGELAVLWAASLEGKVGSPTVRGDREAIRVPEAPAASGSWDSPPQAG